MGDSESSEVDTVQRGINSKMNGEFREDIEVILYKTEMCKTDKLMTIDELKIGYQITKV